MTIRNCNGTPYKLSGSLQMFDPENPEQFLLNSFDSEIIRIAGTPIYYYEVFIQKQTINRIYREDRGKVWANKGIQLYGFYDPIPSQNYLNQFGVDSPDEIQFQFNFREVIKILGHPPKVGSRLFTPHKSEYWEIVQRNAGDFFLWGELRLTLICKRFQESLTTGEGSVTQQQTNFKLNQGRLLGDSNPNPCNK